MKGLARTRSPWAAGATGVAAAVLALDVWLRTPPQAGVMFLLALPVAIVALQHGRRPAILALACAAAVVVGSTTLQHEQLGVAGYATRMLMYGLAAGMGLWLRRSQGADSADPAEVPAEPRPVGPSPSAHNLTPRELEVLRLIACGHTNKEAALALRISVRTIESHRARIQSKLECGGRSDLYRRAQELGLIAA